MGGILYIEKKTIYKRGLFILLFCFSFFLKKKVKGLRSHTAFAAVCLLLGLVWARCAGRSCSVQRMLSAQGPVQTSLVSLAQGLLGSGSRCQVYVGGRQKQNIEALSKFSPCPGRFPHCAYPNTPTCASGQILGREDTTVRILSSPAPQAVPPLCSRGKQSLGLHSNGLGEACHSEASVWVC